MNKKENTTQQQIADALGCSTQYITMMEGRKRPITDEKYDKWIKALNNVDAEVAEIEEIEKEIKKPSKTNKK
ncbi:helix-turn-helix domain-containing protein [Alkaliphilus metalliredigens]|nr:helix-turn-helix transcriptional regulator [Alkaliphilus metalliredigens]